MVLRHPRNQLAYLCPVWEVAEVELQEWVALLVVVWVPDQADLLQLLVDQCLVWVDLQEELEDLPRR